MFTSFRGRITPEDQVTAAYRSLATRPDAWVGFAELRDATGLDPATFTQAVHTLAGHDNVWLTPEVNRKTLTPADHAAAVWIGGEHKHLISFTD